ncbi:MAG TPA: hypothetical protein VK524_19585, partial [Polyangiaceae bacterium]|nr:hypothetical protein [Polyangiaceae bacterium]
MMSPRERLYVIGQNGVGAALANALINGVIGWLITRELVSFPMWKVPGVAGDLLGTAFGITFGTCIGAAFTVRRDFMKKKISLPVISPALTRLIARFPQGTWKRSLWLGFLSILVFGVPVTLLLAASGADALAPNSFIAVKAVFAAVQAAVITPLIVLGV